MNKFSKAHLFCLIVLLSFLLIILNSSSYSQTVKPTPISGQGTIVYNSTDNVYYFVATEGITYAYYLGRTDPTTRGTLNALVVYQGSKYFYPSFVGGITAKLNGSVKGTIGYNFSNVRFDLLNHNLNTTGDTVTVKWRMRYAIDSCDYTYRFSVYGQTLTINIIGDASNKIIGVGFNNALSFDNCQSPSTQNNHYVVNIPCLPIMNVLYNKTLKTYATLFVDWEKTNASGIYPWVDNNDTTGYYSQRVLYNTKTNGQLNQLNETAYLSVSSDLKNVLPNIVGPNSSNRGKLSDKIFISYFQPFPALNQGHNNGSVKYLDNLYKYYGVRDAAFIIKNWSKGQFDFAWPDNWPADPFAMFKGYGIYNLGENSNDSLLAIRDSIRTRGYLFGLHENYIAIGKSSNNAFSDFSKMGRAPNNDTAWTGFLNQGEFSRYLYLLSPNEITNAVNYNSGQMPASFRTNDFAYLDFATASNPSGPDYYGDQTFSFVDFNSGLPGDNAGKFKYTLSKVRELGGIVSNAYNGCPVQGEGCFHFLYAGYYDDFDGRIETGFYPIRGCKAPLLLNFAQKIREKSSSHGVGHIDNFFDQTDKAFTDEQVKEYMATELAYGNGGLVTTMNPNVIDHSLKHACWEQQYLLWIEKMYANAKPIKTEYYGVNSSASYSASNYIRNIFDNHLTGFDDTGSVNFMGRVHVAYDNGLEVWVNRNKDPWAIPFTGENRFYCFNITQKNGIDTMGIGLSPDPTYKFTLPPRSGWLCYSPYWPNGAVWSGPKEIPGQWGGAGIDGGGGITTARIDTGNKPEVVAFGIANPNVNYRIGWNLDAFGNVDHWTDFQIKSRRWWGDVIEGADIAIANVVGNSRPDMILFWIDATSGVPKGYYRIGRDMDNMGNIDTSKWSKQYQLPDSLTEMRNHTQGAGVAVADIDKNGTKDLVFFWIEDSTNANHAHYVIGWNIKTDNTVTSWSNKKNVRGYWGYSNQGAGIAVGDLSSNPKNGELDLLVGWIDNPPGKNKGLYKIGWDLNTSGDVSSWSDVVVVIDTLDADENLDAGIAIDSINMNSRPDLLFFSISDNLPSLPNKAYYRVGLDVGVTSPSPKEVIRNILNENIPTEFQLSQNYPNPFNPTTTIEYALPQDSKVTLILYDILGREVVRLVDGFIKAGYHKEILNANKLSTGVYFYRITAGKFMQTKKLLLLK